MCSFASLFIYKDFTLALSFCSLCYLSHPPVCEGQSRERERDIYIAIKEGGSMRTRRGLCYPRVGGVCSENTPVMKRRDFSGERFSCRKKNRKSPEMASGGSDSFDCLPDDLVISILCKLSSTATCPSDFTNVLLTYVRVCHRSDAHLIKFVLHLRLPHATSLFLFPFIFNLLS